MTKVSAQPIRLTASQVAIFYRRHGWPIAAGSVRRWARDGLLPHVRSMTGRVLFDAVTIEHMVQRCSITERTK